MDKKRIWLISSVVIGIVVLLIAGLLINNHLKAAAVKKDQDAAVQVARDFSYAWFNYSKQTSSTYLEKIKPYMTDAFYNATYYVNTERPQDFVDQKASKATVAAASLKSYDSSEAISSLSIDIQEGTSAAQKTNILVTLTKSENKWLVSNLTIE